MSVVTCADATSSRTAEAWVCVVASAPSRAESFFFDVLNDSRGLFFADSRLDASDLANANADGVTDVCDDSPVI